MPCSSGLLLTEKSFKPVQRRMIKTLPALRNWSYWARLAQHNLHSLERRKQRDDLTDSFSWMKGIIKGDTAKELKLKKMLGGLSTPRHLRGLPTTSEVMAGASHRCVNIAPNTITPHVHPDERAAHPHTQIKHNRTVSDRTPTWLLFFCCRRQCRGITTVK